MGGKDEVVLAAFGQLNRDDEFKIITKIVSNNSKISVRKEACSEKSIPHIKKLMENHETLGEAVSSLKNIRVVKILGSGNDFVEFEYIKGRNVEYETFLYVMSGNYDEAINLIDRIFSLIDSLSSARSRKENEAVQKINDIYNLPSSSTKFTNPGVIDLNLDNFILNPNDELVAFDCEWVFGKPVASDYIKTRLLHTFFARRSDSFAFLPSSESPFKAIVESGNQTLIPNKIYERYSKFLTKDSMKKYWKAEDIFQNSVTKHRVNTATSSYKSLETKSLTSPQLTLPETEESHRISFNDLVVGLNDHIGSLAKDVIKQDEHIRSLQKELTAIKLSKSYRAARKLSSVKKKVIKR